MDKQETDKATVYIETSVISYLTARPSRDIIVGAQQQLTADWWENQRSKYALFVSTVVVEEAAGGDATAAIRRLDALTGIAVLEVTDEITRSRPIRCNAGHCRKRQCRMLSTSPLRLSTGSNI